MAKQKEVSCKKCGKQFFRSNGRYNEAKKFGWNQYCSKKCLFGDRIKQKLLNCECCGKKIFRTPCAVSPHNYCSRSCAAIVNNRNDPKRAPRFRACLKCGNKFSVSGGNFAL